MSPETWNGYSYGIVTGSSRICELFLRFLKPVDLTELILKILSLVVTVLDLRVKYVITMYTFTLACLDYWIVQQ